jgi:hypothetical protein
VPEATPTLPSFSWATPIPSTTGTENQAAKDNGSDFTTDLGPPFDPNTDTKDPVGPPANPYQAGGAPPGSVAGGSGAPGLGGGGGGAGAKDSEEGARLADGGKSITYGQTGGGYTTGARAPSGTSPDLSGLLAQFLPKEEDKKGQNGILDFGGRAPSAGGGDGPLLGPKENIFDRVSKQLLSLDGKGNARFFADLSQWENSVEDSSEPEPEPEVKAPEKPAVGLSREEKKELAKLEISIQKAEKEKAAAEAALADPAIATNSTELTERNKKLNQIETKIAALTAQWEKLESRR